MSDGLFSVLFFAAVTVGSLHTIAPDHWVPFAAIARARDWSPWKTTRVTVLCGFGHVTVSALLGLLGMVFGIRLFEALGRQMESVAGLLLIGFGVAYGVWGWRRAVTARLHAQSHAHGHIHFHTHGHGRPHLHADDADSSTLTVWGLFLLFCADPCVAVIPVMFAAAPLGTAQTAAIVAGYELATILTMVALVLPARAVAGRVIKGEWANRYGDATAGAVIVAVGVAVAALGW